MPNRSHPTNNRFPLVPLLYVASLLGGFAMWRASWLPTPAALGKTSAAVSEPLWYDGAWYWLEGAGTKGSQLVRLHGAEKSVVAAVPMIRLFAVGKDKVVWSVGADKSWTIASSGPDGRAVSTVWSGDREPRGLYVATDRILWLDQLPAIAPDSGPFPPLNPSIRVVSVPLNASGATPTVISEIMEPTGNSVIGIREGDYYISAGRGSMQGLTSIYRVPGSGGPPQRLLAETGGQDALLMPDGTLYWTGPSREASQPERIVCVRRLTPGGRPETLTDWLPYGGRLFKTPRGVCYVDGGFSATAWKVSNLRSLPQGQPMPAGYEAIAAGDNDLLLQSSSGGKGVTLARMVAP